MALSIGPRIGIEGEKDYRDSINKLIQSTKTLDAQMGELKSSFDDSTTAEEKNEKETKNLEDKIKALNEVVKKMEEAVSAAKDSHEDDSVVVQKWEQKLAEAKTQLNNTTRELADHKAATDETKGAVDGLSTAEQNVSDNALNMGSGFSSAIGNMETVITGGGVVAAIGLIFTAMQDVTESVLAAEEQYQDSMAAIAAGTGATGEELKALERQARETWAAVYGQNITEMDTAEAEANISTRFKMTDEALQEATQLVMEFASATGDNASDTVTELANTMWKLGLMTDDSNTNIATMKQLLDETTVATQSVNVSSEEWLQALQDNKGNFDALGMSVKEGSEWLLEYGNVTGSVSEGTSVLTKFVTSMRDSTDDLGGAWKSANLIMERGIDVQSTMNTQIGTTGKTIGDVFSKSKTTDIINSVQAMARANEDYTEAMDTAGGAATQMYLDSVSNADIYQQKLKEIENSTGIPTDISDKVFEATGLYSTLAVSSKIQFEAMKKSQADSTEAMQEKTKDGMADMESKITTSVNNAKSTFENTTLKFGAVEVPIVEGIQTITAGRQNAFSVVGTNTIHYAKAMNGAYLLSNPTIFGMMNGAYLQGGEAGKEIVAGEDYLLNKMTIAVQNAFGYVPNGANGITNNYSSSPTINVYGAPGQDVNELARAIEQRLAVTTNRRRA